MKETLYDEISQGYPSIKGIKRYEREARMQKIDEIIAAYSIKGKDAFLEGYQEIKEGLELQSQGRVE